VINGGAQGKQRLLLPLAHVDEQNFFVSIRKHMTSYYIVELGTKTKICVVGTMLSASVSSLEFDGGNEDQRLITFRISRTREFPVSQPNSTTPPVFCKPEYVDAQWNT
jgi:hypothetical protein